jgi:hypothetical protein
MPRVACGESEFPGSKYTRTSSLRTIALQEMRRTRSLTWRRGQRQRQRHQTAHPASRRRRQSGARRPASPRTKTEVCGGRAVPAEFIEYPHGRPKQVHARGTLMLLAESISVFSVDRVSETQADGASDSGASNDDSSGVSHHKLPDCELSAPTIVVDTGACSLWLFPESPVTWTK